MVTVHSSRPASFALPVTLSIGTSAIYFPLGEVVGLIWLGGGEYLEHPKSKTKMDGKMHFIVLPNAKLSCPERGLRFGIGLRRTGDRS
jgi:hypothetical protein